jgi:RNA polymerase sigma-54 factor
MKPSLQLKLSQHLTLTPQLQQSIRLLQLSTLELNQELERFLQDNPLLERDEDGEEAAPVAPPPTAEGPLTADTQEYDSGAITSTVEVPQDDFDDAPVDMPEVPEVEAEPWTSPTGSTKGAIRVAAATPTGKTMIFLRWHPAGRRCEST